MRLVFRVLGGAVFLFLGWLFFVWPPPAWYINHWPRETAFMALRQRESDTARVERYEPVPLDSIAPVASRVVMIGEDERFTDHGGVDYIALLKALGYRRDTFDIRSAKDR
ncbi:MAG: transglycosylase domain-containing protein, partial [Gemmatimonadales bacterium]